VHGELAAHAVKLASGLADFGDHDCLVVTAVGEEAVAPLEPEDSSAEDAEDVEVEDPVASSSAVAAGSTDCVTTEPFVLASAGSCPLTSWTNTTAHAAMKIDTASVTTRRRSAWI
jgi:hypothetical protein